MTSYERREQRYKRRKQKREENKKIRNKDCTFENVTDFNNLKNSFYKARKTVNWKASVQRYGCDVLKNAMKASTDLRNGKSVSKGFIEFDICERGKRRHITSVHISERVVQKCLCDYGIVPVIEKSLIYDNGASQKGKGTDFARDRLKEHLRRYYRKHGREGYIVMGDCHNFFGSIDHSVVERNVRKYITDERVCNLTMSFVEPFKHGLGLGSQVCQILAVSYQNNVDHCIKEVMRCKYYGRYMDDFYIICETKEKAAEILKEIKKMYHDIGIKLNDKKTDIVKLTHGFTWLQDRMYITNTGKVIDRPGRKNITRNRKKLKKIAKLFNEGYMDYKEVEAYYSSHKGYYKNKNGYYTKRNMDKLFNELFIRRFLNETSIVEQR